MASLKEVKNRITSVRTTRKITQARQMVSSAQLHHAQGALAAARNYRDALAALWARTAGEVAAELPFCEVRPAGDVAVVILSANGGMCGSFNARTIKELHQIAREPRTEHKVFFPIGQKVSEAVAAAGYPAVAGDNKLMDKASCTETAATIIHLAEEFTQGKWKRVEIIYADFRTVGSQPLRRDVLLPLEVPTESKSADEYIVEPSLAAFAGELAKMLVTARFCADIASHRASEHATRMIAMQLATENADDLLDQLNLTYNKLRQQNITTELLDIIGSSFA